MRRAGRRGRAGKARTETGWVKTERIVKKGVQIPHLARYEVEERYRPRGRKQPRRK